MILGEKFVWKYVSVGLILVSVGCVTVAANANTEEVSYTDAEVIELLLAPRTLIFFAINFTLMIICLSIMKLVLVGVRRFEKDVDDYEQTMASKTKKEGHENALSILPKRKKASPHTQ